MSANNIRMSRISHPRGTFWAMLLLTVVFLGFGVWAEACLPETTAFGNTLPANEWVGQTLSFLR